MLARVLVPRVLSRGLTVRTGVLGSGDEDAMVGASLRASGWRWTSSQRGALVHVAFARPQDGVYSPGHAGAIPSARGETARSHGGEGPDWHKRKGIAVISRPISRARTAILGRKSGRGSVDSVNDLIASRWCHRCSTRATIGGGTPDRPLVTSHAGGTAT